MPDRVATCTVLVFVGVVCGFIAGSWIAKGAILNPIEVVTIAESGMHFRARLDTGAVVSSINAHDIRVIDGGERPSREDVGKLVSFVLINGAGERAPATARIEQVRGIRTADCREVRYHVYLNVVYRGRTRRVLTNLNDRSRAGDKFLLGRNWLQQGYAVGWITESEI